MVDNLLMDRQKPMTGVLNDRIWLLVVNRADILPAHMPRRLVDVARDLMFDIGLIKNTGRKTSAAHDIVYDFPRGILAVTRVPSSKASRLEK